METVLLIDENKGIYIPKIFAERFGGRISVEGISTHEILTTLSSPENEDYWEMWDEVLSGGVLDLKAGRYKYRLEQTGDLWAIPFDTLPERRKDEYFIGNYETTEVPEKLSSLRIRFGTEAFTASGHELPGYYPMFIHIDDLGRYNTIMSLTNH